MNRAFLRTFGANERGLPRVDHGGAFAHQNDNIHQVSRQFPFRECVCCKYTDRENKMKVQLGMDGDDLQAPDCSDDPRNYPDYDPGDDPRNYPDYDPANDTRKYNLYLCAPCVKRHKVFIPSSPVRREAPGVCQFSLLNNLDTLPPPVELERLNWMEQRCLSPVVVLQTFVIKPFGLHARRGQVIHIPMDVSSNLAMLAPRSKPSHVQMTVLVRSSHNDAKKRLIYGYYTKVDMAKVYAAFLELKRLDHRAFRDIEWPADCPMSGVSEHPDLVTEVHAFDEYDHVSHEHASLAESEFEPLESMLESAVVASNQDVPYLAEIMKKTKKKNKNKNKNSDDDDADADNDSGCDDDNGGGGLGDDADDDSVCDDDKGGGGLGDDDGATPYAVEPGIGTGDHPDDYRSDGFSEYSGSEVDVNESDDAPQTQEFGNDPADYPNEYPDLVSSEDDDAYDDNVNKKPNNPSKHPQVTLPPLQNEDVMWNDAQGREEAGHFNLFPDGKGGHNDPTRPRQLTLREYLAAKLFSSDKRWSQDAAWVFARLHQLNREDMNKSIMFILNHGYASVSDMTADNVLNLILQRKWVPEDVRQHLYPQVGQRIRNSPQFWRNVRRRALTMIKNLGCPHFFMTLSPNDLGDHEFFLAADPIKFKTKADVDKLGLFARARVVNENCALFVRMMYERFYEVLNLLCSDQSPLGFKMVDFF